MSMIRHHISIRSAAARRARLGRAIVLCSVALAPGCLATSNAAASSDSYGGGVGCISFQQQRDVPNNTGYELFQGLLNDAADNPQTVGGQVDFQRPQSVRDYTGTTYLYWVPYIKITDNSTGVYAAAYATAAYGSYAHWWTVVNGWLNGPSWNSQSTNLSVGFPAAPGYTYQVWGVTYWWNGSSWFYSESQYLGGCRF
jgi:hypothetical protein